MLSTAAQQLLTIRDLIRFAVSQFEAEPTKIFYGHGTAHAFDEAVYLVLGALHLPIEQLDFFLDAKLLIEETQTVLQLLEKRITTQEPIPYLINKAWLQGYRFYVDKRVIIPRSFIAELLVQQLNPWVNSPNKIQHALDLCTGSGCLAIIMADAFRCAKIDAVDISPEALTVAAHNISNYKLEDRIRIIQSDLFSKLDGLSYDLIITNPPYVDAASMARLPKEYLHEPILALSGGNDGFDIINQILKHASDFLNPAGLLVVEIGHHRALLEEFYPHLPFTWLPVSEGEEDRFVFVISREELESL